MVKLENDIVVPLKPKFYRRYVDDIYNRRKKNTEDILFKELNSYHPNINLTVEINPTKFLDTKLICVNGVYKTMVNRKETKLPIHWSSKIPKRYKRNSVLGDLHRAKRISSDFQTEVIYIKNKFLKADYPLRFIDSIVNNFNQCTTEKNDSFIIPPYLFEEEKPFILIEIPFCEKNENKSKDFIRKFHDFTNGKYRLSIKWITKKVQSFFPLKDKNIYPSCKIYEGICCCKENYIGETERNTGTRWNEHNNPTHSSEPAEHLKWNRRHWFIWKIIANAPKNTRTRRYLEALFIAKYKPTLNNQAKFKKLHLFRNGIT